MIFRSVTLGGFFFILFSIPALASARDDVMSGSARCAAIQANRDWLNCFYGAAQPMRAELGLPPAPSTQTSRVPPRRANLTAAPAYGGSRDDVMSGTARCAAIEDNHTWLDCYYGAAQPMRAELGLAPALPSQILLVPTRPHDDVTSVRPAPKRGSGGIADIFGGRTLVQKIPLVSYKLDKYGAFTAKLSNGQTWRQVEDDSVFPHWTKPAGSYRATISSGAFGSFNMRIDGDSNVYKVHPVSEQY